jgi:arylsulfatase A
MRLLMKLPLLILVLVFVPLVVSVAAEETKPNFIVINIDDLGYADIAPFGSPLNRTPHLDRMAKEGRKLTSYYAAPVCSPSRAALMTGSYPKRALPIPHVFFPSAAVGLNPDETTIAEVLRDAGYRTACVGKWHLGDQPDFLPTAQGFDYYLGIPYSNDMGTVAEGSKSDLGAPLPDTNENAAKAKAAAEDPETGLKGNRQPPLPLVENDKVVGRVKQDEQQAIVSTFTEAAVKFVRESAAKPFFLYLPHSAVHFPLYPGKDWVGKSKNGLYGDWVEEIDASVGRILDTIRELGLERRTLVIFTSDNGGTSRGTNGPLRGHKGSTWEGGVRAPTIVWWPGTIPADTSSDKITGMHDVLPTFASLAGVKGPDGRKLDGIDASGVWLGKEGAKGHETFHYFRGFELQAIRRGPWKLHFGTAGPVKAKGNAGQRPVGLALFNLEFDLGEKNNVADTNPEVVKELQALAAAMDADLGVKVDSQGPGVRPLGRVEHPEPFLDHEGKVRANAVGKVEQFP